MIAKHIETAIVRGDITVPLQTNVTTPTNLLVNYPAPTVDPYSNNTITVDTPSERPYIDIKAFRLKRQKARETRNRLKHIQKASKKRNRK